ncbi:MAG: L,D-transpeptidase family protein [Methylococcales bacterium]|nr:L,D-transpeptidase family protein [Methylococcales bacterium]
MAINNVIDSILVNKTEKKMYLLSDGQKVREFDVVFGGNPIGHKQQQGDEKTPEGKYILDYKNADSSFYKSIHISYPNEDDIFNAKIKGVNPGGLIMIHGQKNGLDKLSWLYQRVNWTKGCIAVTNIEMDEIWAAVEVGIPIEILP